MRTIELSKKEVTNLLATNLDELIKYDLLTKNEYRAFSKLLSTFNPGPMQTARDKKTIEIRPKKRILDSVYAPLLVIPIGALYFFGMYFLP